MKLLLSAYFVFWIYASFVFLCFLCFTLETFYFIIFQCFMYALFLNLQQITFKTFRSILNLSLILKSIETYFESQ